LNIRVNFGKVAELKSLQKVYLNLFQYGFSSKVFELFDFESKKPCLKIENSFCSPFTFWPASSLWPALFFLGTSPLRSAFQPKSAHPRPPPFSFLLPK
jgi:hypothetical protein